MKHHVVLQLVFLNGAIASQFHNPGIARGELRYSNASISSSTTAASISTTINGPPDGLPASIVSSPPSLQPSLLTNTFQTNCLWNSTATYVGSVYPTVYVTVNSSYEVTVSASNVSLTHAPTLLETPLEACLSTIIPLPNIIGATPPPPPPPPPPPTRTPLYRTSLSSMTASPDPPSALSSEPPDDGQITYSLPTPDGQATYSIPTLVGFKITSTVIVTKKTPVPVVQVPQQTNPPVTFPQPSPSKGIGSVVTLKGGSSIGNNDNSNNNNNNNDGNNKPNGSSNDNDSNGGNNNRGSNTANGNSGSGNGNSPTAAQGSGSNSTPSPVVSGINSAVSKLGQIIASIINSPFVAPAPITTQPAIAAPTTAIIGGVPVVINTSDVRIGSSVVPLPTAVEGKTVIAVDGQTLTILPGQIIGPSTTYSIASASAQNFILKSAPATVTQSSSVVTANGIVLTIGPSQAVISGTTYRIGINASPTAIIVHSQTISLGVDGVVFPSTTFTPAMTIANNKYEILVVNGLTVSVDATEAIISGTTFTIGPGALTSTATIGSQTLTIGPNGVVLASTTIHPTNVPTVAATTGAGSSDGISVTQTSSTLSTASAQLRNHAVGAGAPEPKYILAWTLVLNAAVWVVLF